MNDKVLYESLRPKKMEQMILPKRIRDIIGDGSLNQNYLFYGSPGLGKTSAAKILAEKHPHIYINCSDETGVDVVRNKINTFCSTISVFDGEEKKKVVILDEMDGVSNQFFKALRGTIEKFIDNSRFIGTCNYFNEIPDAMHSRFSLVNFELLDKDEEMYVFEEQKKRALMVLKKIGINCDEEVLDELVGRNFPDMRKLFNKIQSIRDSGMKTLTKDFVMKTEWSFEDIFKICISVPDPQHNYQFLVNQYNSKVDDVLSALGTEFPKWISEKHSDMIRFIPGVIIEVADYQAQRIQVIDPVISMLACVFRIQNIFHSK